MSESIYRGDWFLPNHKKYPGSLSIDKEAGNILLEVYSSESIEGDQISFPNNKQEFYHQYIHGEAQGGPYTLYHCTLVRCSTIGKNFYKIEYNSEYLICGALISRLEGFKVRSAKFLYPNLSSWYDGYQSFDKLQGIKGNLTEIEQTETEILQINEHLELIFIDHIFSRLQELNVSYKLSYNKYLVFNYSEDVPFAQMLKDSFTFLNLLSFSYSRPQRHKIISVDIAHEFTDNMKSAHACRNDFARYYLTNFSLHENKSIPAQGLHQNNMIISGWKLTKEELNKVIVKWYGNPRYANIIEYYLDSNNWFEETRDAKLTNVMFNNRFLNLIQGLEDVYREDYAGELTITDENQFNEKKRTIMSHIEDKELRQWLNNTFKFTRYPRLEEKLAVITQACLPLIKELYGEISLDEFPMSAKNFRHQLSHGMK